MQRLKLMFEWADVLKLVLIYISDLFFNAQTIRHGGSYVTCTPSSIEYFVSNFSGGRTGCLQVRDSMGSPSASILQGLLDSYRAISLLPAIRGAFI